MARVSALLNDDRKWLETEIDGMILGQTSVRFGEVATELASRLDLMASHGDDDAARVIRALVADGLYALVQTQAKRQQNTVRIAATGQLVSIPARVGARARNAEGVQLKVYQQTLWYEMSWDDFVAMIDSRRDQIAQLADKVTAFEEVMRYRDLYPESVTPGEALRLAGVDPESIGFNLVA